MLQTCSAIQAADSAKEGQRYIFPELVHLVRRYSLVLTVITYSSCHIFCHSLIPFCHCFPHSSTICHLFFPLSHCEGSQSSACLCAFPCCLLSWWQIQFVHLLLSFTFAQDLQYSSANPSKETKPQQLKDYVHVCIMCVVMLLCVCPSLSLHDLPRR